MFTNNGPLEKLEGNFKIVFLIPDNEDFYYLIFD